MLFNKFGPYIATYLAKMTRLSTLKPFRRLKLKLR